MTFTDFQKLPGTFKFLQIFHELLEISSDFQMNCRYSQVFHKISGTSIVLQRLPETSRSFRDYHDIHAFHKDFIVLQRLARTFSDFLGNFKHFPWTFRVFHGHSGTSRDFCFLPVFQSLPRIFRLLSGLPGTPMKTFTEYSRIFQEGVPVFRYTLRGFQYFPGTSRWCVTDRQRPRQQR